MYCKAHDVCQQVDDMSGLVDDIKKSDGFVIGSPIYMGSESSQTKKFHDRLYYFGPGPGFASKMPAGKKAVLFFSQNHPDKNAFRAAIEPLPRFLSTLGVEVVGCLFAPGGAKALEDKVMREAAFLVGVSLVKPRRQ